MDDHADSLLRNEVRLRWGRKLDKWDSDRLLPAAKAVEQLQDSPGWAILQELLELRDRDLVESLMGSKILTHEEYAARSSMAKAIRELLYLPAAVVAAGQAKERELAQKQEAVSA